MARIDIKMIESFEFETELTVRITDINYGNHVGGDAFISLLHEARVRFLQNLGFAESDIGGQALIISDLAVSYKAQAFYRDRLKFSIGVGDFNKYGCDIFYKVTNAEDGSLVLTAKTGIVFYDTAEKKITPVPDIFLTRLKIGNSSDHDKNSRH